MKSKKLTALQRQLAEDWERTLAAHSKPLEKGARAQKLPPKPPLRDSDRLDIKKVLGSNPRETARLPSRVTPGGSTAAAAPFQYTGTKMLGVGQMHKSNAVPIFSDDEAQDIAKMRR